MSDFRQVTTSRSTITTRTLLIPKSLAREVRRLESSVISEGIELGIPYHLFQLIPRHLIHPGLSKSRFKPVMW